MQTTTTFDAAIARKYPEAVAIAIAKDAADKYNPISLGWVMSTSHQPPMMAIAIGLQRHSLKAIRLSKEFVISYPSSAMGEDVMFFGTNSGRDMDKLAERKTPTQPATEIDCVLLADAVANFECVLDSELVTGDHVIFAGRIVAAHENTDPAARRLYTQDADFKMGGVVPG